MNANSQALERFVAAQERDYSQALAELIAGKKQTHWIWYVLPQLRELGRSQMAKEYGIANREEAEAYFAHPVLGPRLLACVNAILEHGDRTAIEILGETDAIKFQSCLTLFAQVASSEPAFSSALALFYKGNPDSQTIRVLGSGRQ